MFINLGTIERRLAVGNWYLRKSRNLHSYFWTPLKVHTTQAKEWEGHTVGTTIRLRIPSSSYLKASFLNITAMSSSLSCPFLLPESKHHIFSILNTGLTRCRNVLSAIVDTRLENSESNQYVCRHGQSADVQCSFCRAATIAPHN